MVIRSPIVVAQSSSFIAYRMTQASPANSVIEMSNIGHSNATFSAQSKRKQIPNEPTSGTTGLLGTAVFYTDRQSFWGSPTLN
jgi:hypothetical protein